jgi:hypothetical protein
VLGDLAGDLSELRRDGRVCGGDTFVGVQDLVVFAARERIETLCDPGVADVGEVAGTACRRRRAC